MGTLLPASFKFLPHCLLDFICVYCQNNSLLNTICSWGWIVYHSKFSCLVKEEKKSVVAHVFLVMCDSWVQSHLFFFFFFSLKRATLIGQFFGTSGTPQLKHLFGPPLQNFKNYLYTNTHLSVCLHGS